MQTGHYDNMNLKDKGSCQEIEVLQNSPNFCLYVFVMNWNMLFFRIAMAQGLERGWFSYTDLMTINKDPQLLQAYSEIAYLLPKV